MNVMNIKSILNEDEVTSWYKNKSHETRIVKIRLLSLYNRLSA